MTAGGGDPRYGCGPGLVGLVSVVIPSYNRAYTIGDTLESVVRQSHSNLEIVVVDDGSEDDTRAVVERFGPRIRYLYQANGGVAAARNHGLQAVRGEFVAFLDSDDQWLPWKVEAQVAFLRRFPDVGMVWTDMLAVDAQGLIVSEAHLRTFYHAYRLVQIEKVCQPAGTLGSIWPQAPAELTARETYQGSIFSHMLLGNLVHTSTVMLRRTRLREVGGFDEQLTVSGEDYEFHLHTAFAGPVGFLDASSIRYRVGAADQLTAPHHMIEVARNNLATITKWLERGRGRIDLPRYVLRRRMGDSLAWLGQEELLIGSRASARRHLWQSMRAHVRMGVTALFFLSILPVSVAASLRALRRRLRSRLRLARLP